MMEHQKLANLLHIGSDTGSVVVVTRRFQLGSVNLQCSKPTPSKSSFQQTHKAIPHLQSHTQLTECQLFVPTLIHPGRSLRTRLITSYKLVQLLHTHTPAALTVANTTPVKPHRVCEVYTVKFHVYEHHGLIARVATNKRGIILQWDTLPPPLLHPCLLQHSIRLHFFNMYNFTNNVQCTQGKKSVTDHVIDTK